MALPALRTRLCAPLMNGCRPDACALQATCRHTAPLMPRAMWLLSPVRPLAAPHLHPHMLSSPHLYCADILKQLSSGPSYVFANFELDASGLLKVADLASKGVCRELD